MHKDIDKFRGIVPPLVTPLTPDEDIDERGAKRLMEHVIAGGVHGIFLLGTTGEGMRISDRECERLVDIATGQVGGRVAVLVGCSDFGTRRTLERIRMAEKYGVDAAVVTLSYYLPRFSQEDVLAHYRQLADESKLPVFIYNLPQGGESTVELDTVDELSEVENIPGIKDSSQKWAPIERLIKRFKDRESFRVFVGTEILMVESLMAGCDGCVPSIGNVRPDLCVKLYEAVRSGDLKSVEALKKEMMDTRERVYTRGTSWVSYIAGIKSALDELGIPGKTVTKPFSIPFVLTESRTEDY